ncbi:hypothetical protein [Micromonospora humida]|uniref:Uncharacterized protein n=1 Tax=Micromonospora humida TaxID=2809018 RepID=A0ABS2IU69_9ACTN|nr:hypothetical protein [Micromonospora humida]MBM7076908.1 hypothetical protein [Micromonospora humida]
MAFRTWGKLLLTALGVSMLAGAGQLGIAYGFGIVRLTGDFTDVNRWPAQLAWVGWFAVTAAVVGAVLTGRLARREGLPEGTPVQLAISGVAALGALVVAPLCMQPARAADLTAVDPVWAVGICAVAGAVVGAGAASAVLLRPPLGWNVALLGGTIWLVALLSVAPAVLSSEPLRTVRLGVLEPSWLGADQAQRLAMLLLPVIALVAGAVTGGLARRRGHPPLTGGATGVAGPVLLAFAYLTAGPGDQVDRYQLAPYYGAVIAVVAGALGSVAATVARWPLLPARAARRDGGTAIEPTDILAPLPAVSDPARTAAAGSGPDRTGLTGSDLTGSELAGTGADEPVTVDLSAATRALHPDRPDAARSRATDRPAAAASAMASGSSADIASGVGGVPAVPGTGPGWPSPDAPGTGRHPAHWDWPDPAATVADRHASRTTPPPTRPEPSRTGAAPAAAAPTGLTPTGASTTGATWSGSTPIEPAPSPNRPAPTGPDPAAATPDGPAGDAPDATSSAGAGAGRAGSPRSRSGQRKAAAAEQAGSEVGAVRPAAGAGPATGEESMATPKPRAKRASRARSTATGAAAVPAGRPEPSPVAETGGTGEDRPAGSGPTGSPTPDGVNAAPVGTTAPETTSRGGTAAATPITEDVPPVAGVRHVAPGGVEATPRPRHHLPDLGGTGGPAGAHRPAPARAALPFPEPGATEQTDAPKPVSLRWEPEESSGTAPVDGPPADPDQSGPAPEDGNAPGDGNAPEQTGKARGRRGLFRRNRSPQDAPTDEVDPKSATPDDEYVDWVTGLGKPLADNEPDRDSGRRSLRTSGRHHHRD